MKKSSKLKRRQTDPDPVFYRVVDMSDLPSQYAEDIETLRQILNLPDPKDTMPRSSTTILALDDEKGQQECRPRGHSPTFPLSTYPKDAFKKFEQDFQAANLPEGKYIKPPASTSKWDNLVLRTDYRIKICITKPCGASVGKAPLQVVKEFEHQARQNLCTVNFASNFAKTDSICNSIMEKCQDSIKSTAKRVKSHIQKGANPEKAARHGYETTCDYLDILNKRILIQQRALACLSKALAHILQRELYTMGNSTLIRREAEMTHLQPQLGDSRCQEHRSSPFWPTPLFQSQLVKD